MQETLFDFDDILIQPQKLTNISSRSEVNPYKDNGTLPIMTAPMDTVVNEKNYKIFRNLGICPVLPRTPNPMADYVSSNMFLSYSLDDFERIFLFNNPFANLPENTKLYALIDIANGHMKKLYDVSRKAKIKYGDLLYLMVGNVANPETYYEYSDVNVDAVRIGIGNGNGCLTTVQTGVGYPMASLIEKCRQVKVRNNYNTEIIADGGFKKFADIIKALALGADYVMLGSILNKALESAGETCANSSSQIIDQYSDEAKLMFESEMNLVKVFRGMSTKEVQKSWGRDKTITSEGVVRTHKVEYTLSGWVQNFQDYLKSAMSYTNKKTLNEFIGNVKYNHITQNSFRRFDK